MVNIDGPEILATRDLLGEFSKARNINNKKKDHMMEEKEKINIVHPLGPTRNWDSLLHLHHELKPGVSRRSRSPDSPLSSSSSSINNNHPKFTLNSHKNPILKPLLQDEESCSLELKLNPSSRYYDAFKPELIDSLNVLMSSGFDEKGSVICTLDKVKSALERAKKRSPSDKEESQGEARAIVSNKGGIMFAAGCPGCLLYVIASRDDPKCPRCNYSFSPNCDDVVVKKPRFDLN